MYRLPIDVQLPTIGTIKGNNDMKQCAFASTGCTYYRHHLSFLHHQFYTFEYRKITKVFVNICRFQYHTTKVTKSVVSNTANSRNSTSIQQENKATSIEKDNLCNSLPYLLLTKQQITIL